MHEGQHLSEHALGPLLQYSVEKNPADQISEPAAAQDTEHQWVRHSKAWRESG